MNMKQGIELTASSAHAAGISLHILQARQIDAEQLRSKTRETADYAKQVAEGGSFFEHGWLPRSDSEGVIPVIFRGTEFVPIKEGLSVALRDANPDEHSFELKVRYEVVGVRRKTEKVAIISP